MKFSVQKIINTSKELILNPKLFWVSIKGKQDGKLNLLLGYFLPYLIVVSIAVFLGELFKSNHFYIGFALLKSIREVVLFVLQYLIAVLFTNELIKTFGGEKNIEVSRKLVIYSLTPFLMVSVITGLFPFLYVIDILGLFSFYIFWLGVKSLLVFPDDKTSNYTTTTIAINFLAFSFLSIILSKLLMVYY